MASLVGHDLQIVAMAKGKKLAQKAELVEPGASQSMPAVERAFEFVRTLLDREISVKASQGHASISEKRRAGFQAFVREVLRVRLPGHRDFAIGNIPNVDERSVYAFDLREGRLKEYYPVREPSNPEIQQGFAAVLKDAVRDVIAFIPSRW